MKVVEQFILGKNKDQNLCEDGYFVSDDFCVVVDGATAKSARRFDGKSSGRIAMEIIKRALPKIPQKSTAQNAFKIITKELADEYRDMGLYEHLKKHYEERPTASIVIYSNYRKELWFVGDCQALVDGKPYTNNKLIDDIAGYARAYFLELAIRSGESIEQIMKKEVDIGREFIDPFLKKQGLFQNIEEETEYSHEVVDGMDIPKRGIKIFKIADAKTVILASDGYPKLFPTLKKSEEYLEYINKNDPLCYKLNKGAKAISKGCCSYDDRVYVKLKV